MAQNHQDNQGSNPGGNPRHSQQGSDSAGGANKQNQQGGGKSDRGFASMDKEKQKEIASQGGRASHQNDGKSQSGKKGSNVTGQGSGMKDE